MGNLRHFDLSKYGADSFIETGTGKGLGVEYATSFGFKKVFSIEYVDSLYQEALNRFTENNVIILKGVSWEVLEFVFSFKLGKCVFWLDAHLPGVDYGLADVSDEKNLDIRMPLIKELETIKKLCNGEYVILIDDLRFYTKDNFISGNLPDEFMVKGYEDILNMFKETHDYKIHLEDDGYLEITPKILV